MRVIGFDPGFAAFGWAEAHVDRGFIAFTKLGSFHTKKDPERSAAQDLFDRCRELTSGLLTLDVPHVYCVEAMSHPRNASSATKLGASHGVVASVIEGMVSSCDVVLRSPWEARKVLTGLKKPTEGEAHDALRTLYPEVADITKDFRKLSLPHALDAGVQVAAWWIKNGHGLT